MHKKIALGLVLMFVLLQTGCWNAREINELAFVLSIGLDKTSDGFMVTAQIAKPTNYSKSPTGGSAEKEKPFWVVSSTGKTIFEAIRSMASISPRRIFWSHIKVIIISEKLAKSNTLEILDFFSRNPELRLRTLVAVTPGEAGKLFEVIPMMEKDPALHLEKIIKNKSLAGISHDIMLKDFLEDYLDPNVGPAATRLVLYESESGPAIKTEGAYVFGSDNLAGSLNKEEARGLLWVENKMNNSVIVVDCPYDGLPITMEIKKGKLKIDSYLDNSKPYFTIKVDAIARLSEQGCLTDFNNMEELDKLKKSMESAIKKDVQSVISKAKDLNVDFLNLSRIMHRQHKNEWHQMSATWNEQFKDVDASIIVNVKVPHMSLAKPLIPIKTPNGNVK